MIVCSDCNRAKPIESFSRRPDGRLYSWCRPCHVLRYGYTDPDARAVAVEYQSEADDMRQLLGARWAHRLAQARRKETAIA